MAKSKKRRKKPKAPACPYCGSPSRLADSQLVYGGRSYGPIYICQRWPDCDSYVGCHPGTNHPLGRLANPQLRKSKRAAHAAFDPLWRGGLMVSRQEAYLWLSHKLGIPASKCHIGMFDVEQCEAVVRACEARAAEAKQ